MRIHIALGVIDIEASVTEYENLLGVPPSVVVPGEYALFRTDVLNFSLRKVDGPGGTLRHLGFEDPEAHSFSEYRDQNGILWERFDEAAQRAEILATWPHAVFRLPPQ